MMICEEHRKLESTDQASDLTALADLPALSAETTNTRMGKLSDSDKLTRRTDSPAFT